MLVEASATQNHAEKGHGGRQETKTKPGQAEQSADLLARKGGTPIAYNLQYRTATEPALERGPLKCGPKNSYLLNLDI